MNKWWKYAGWIGLVILALIFFQAGATKLIGIQVVVEGFHKYGFPAWFRITIGSVEIVSAIALVIPYSSRYGAMSLAVVMIGAITTVLVKGQAGKAVVPVIILCFLVWIAVVRKPADRHQSNKETIIS